MTPSRTIQDSIRQLVGEQIDAPNLSAEWKSRYRRVLDPRDSVQVHIAVFVEPFLSWVLDGSKVIESRFSMVRCAPWETVHRDDVVLMKQSSGAILGAFAVESVNFYRVVEGELDNIKERFGDDIRADGPEFWERRSGSKYATLIEISDPYPIGPVVIPKRDRRAWVVLPPIYDDVSLF